MLVQLVSTPAALPQVAGSTPGGSEFRLRVKKIPLAGLVCQSASVGGPFRSVATGVTGYWRCRPKGQGATGVPAQPAQATVPAVTAPSVRAGPGFGGFSVGVLRSSS
jgi:hypothetical protein